MNTNDVVVEVKPEEVVAETVGAAETAVTEAKTAKFDAKKGLMLTGLVLTGLVVGYAGYKGVKFLKSKFDAKKAAKAEAEPVTEETTEK